jgi:phosphoribosylformylglycinamidine cyclo-ligase
MARVFNLGLGMVVIVGADSTDAALGALRDSGLEPVVVGRVEEGERGVDLVGPSLWSDGA